MANLSIGQKSEQIEQALKPELTNQYVRFLKIKHALEKIVLILITWNIWFIPLQFGFVIPFKGLFLAFDIISLLVYLVNIGFRFH
jgi:hypothetical protein